MAPDWRLSTCRLWVLRRGAMVCPPGPQGLSFFCNGRPRSRRHGRVPLLPPSCRLETQIAARPPPVKSRGLGQERPRGKLGATRQPFAEGWAVRPKPSGEHG
jgi:hypothetical protein